MLNVFLVQSRTAPPTGGEEWGEDIGKYLVRYLCFLLSCLDQSTGDDAVCFVFGNL